MKFFSQPLNRPLALLRLILVITISMSCLGLREFIRPVIKSGVMFQSRTWMVVTDFSYIVIGIELLLLIATWTPLRNKILRTLQAVTRLLASLRGASLVLFVGGVCFYAWVVFGRFGYNFPGILTRLVLFWYWTLIGCILLKAWSLKQADSYKRSWREFLAVSMLFSAFIYQVATFFPDISVYPFTLSWSETSRFYYASLFFSRRIYGLSVPPTVLHPSRYLMQAIPFLVAGTPLWLHRAWQVFLWLGTSLLSSVLLMRRLSIPERPMRWLVVAWSFLFILVGPVYYHLQIPLILVLWAFDLGWQHPRGSRSAQWSFLKALGVVILASLWAGISRINWFPLPGMLATALYLLEKPAVLASSTAQPSWRAYLIYLLQPAFWLIVGTGAAFAFQAFYITWSGNTAEHFASSLTSDLLWYRLLPSGTYPPGILPAILLVSLPMFLFIQDRMVRQSNGVAIWKRVHPLRWLGLGGMLLILFSGGLVVSVKIGGGSNLHNLDAYLSLLLVITVYIFFDKAVPEPQKFNAVKVAAEVSPNPQAETLLTDTSHLEKRAGTSIRMQIAVVLALSTFSFFVVASKSASAPLPDEAEIRKSMDVLSRFARQISQKGGDILFISNRHLLTFGYLEGIALTPDYERVFLMEMAMAGNPAYLERFHNDLKNHRFALIVSEPLYAQEKGEAARFGEENNAWVQQVSNYILCYYKSDRLLRSVRIELFAPRPDAKDCP